jgi:hypothetical protein
VGRRAAGVPAVAARYVPRGTGLCVGAYAARQLVCSSAKLMSFSAGSPARTTVHQTRLRWGVRCQFLHAPPWRFWLLVSAPARGNDKRHKSSVTNHFENQDSQK